MLISEDEEVRSETYPWKFQSSRFHFLRSENAYYLKSLITTTIVQDLKSASKGAIYLLYQGMGMSEFSSM